MDHARESRPQGRRVQRARSQKKVFEGVGLSERAVKSLVGERKKFHCDHSVQSESFLTNADTPSLSCEANHLVRGGARVLCEHCDQRTDRSV